MNSCLLRMLDYALLLACLCCSTPALTLAVQVSHSGPKPADYGEEQGFPVGNGRTWNELSHLVGVTATSMPSSGSRYSASRRHLELPAGSPGIEDFV